MEITKEEKRIIELLRKLENYGKIEIAKNQDGKQLSVYLINTIKEIIIIEN